MRKRSTKVFELIPSVQTRKQSPGPIAFIPALPIKLETVGSGTGHYAVVDTAAKISSISSALVPGDLLLGTDDTIRATSSQDPIRIVKFSIILCDTSFSPWAHLSDVPFAIFPGREPSTQSSLVLGVDSCLSRLVLNIDFPQRKLKVSVPTSLIVSAKRRSGPEIPTRIKQGENLIKAGSYNAAVAMIAAGLEEALSLSSGPEQKLSLTWKDTFERSHIDHRFDDSLRQQFHEMWNLRNRAVHGPKEREISEDEALRFLKIAKTMWTQLHKTKKTKV